MTNQRKPDERTADAVEDLGELFGRAFSTGAATDNGGGVVEHNGMKLTEDLETLTTVIGEGLHEVAEAVNELTRTLQQFMNGSYVPDFGSSE